MEQSQLRTETFVTIKKRILKYFVYQLDDKQVLQLAIACSMREAQDVIGFMFPRAVANTATKVHSAAALTHGEWKDIFGYDINPLRDGGIIKNVQSTEFQSHITAIAEALRMTISESQQRTRWQSAWSQALCYVASHMKEPNSVIESVIGTVVRADHRRLEELHCQIDDNGYDIMLMSKIIIALSNSVM